MSRTSSPATDAAASRAEPSAAEAQAFIEAAEASLLELGNRQQRAAWVQATYITDDTERIAAEANKDLIAATVEYAVQATRFDGLALRDDVARKLKLLKLSLSLPAPRDAKLQTELTELAASLEGLYGKGKYCPPGKECQDIGALSRILAESRDPDALLEAWRGWHGISPPMRPKYERFVSLANEGARTLGFADMGALWRSNYDLPPEAFSAEVERLWQQVRPLYTSLHAYVRTRLSEKYGPRVVPREGPLPAHVLGNMWAQSWDNVYPLVAPALATPAYDLTALLRARKLDARGMVRSGERFFTSLGFAPLPDTFWERSLFTKPADRDVVCHASAWDVDNEEDLRIKMCIEITGEDFVTVHHELGHNFYQRAYNQQPFLYQDSANDGFHEAVGDTVALSITPEYLQQIGLIQQVPDPSKDLGLLMRQALDKVAFLPFGVMIDQWRWQVFSGQVKPTDYNKAWWDLRVKYQGVRPPVARTEQEFDPGAKYHVPGNTPYTRYFLADILQYQLHEGLCKAAGNKSPLHRCSVYGNKAAGQRLEKMLAMGLSRPWPEALEAVTGTKQMDGTAIVNYFAPLKTWLDQQNQG
ncbi:MAG TPA: M2 family metallopeptidase, partial [Vicinamibacteria bacterium]